MIFLIVIIGTVALLIAVARMRSEGIVTRSVMPPAGESPIAEDEMDEIDETSQDDEDEEDDSDVEELIQANRFVEAIKLYREKYDVDLTTAKQAVDRLAGR